MGTHLFESTRLQAVSVRIRKPTYLTSVECESRPRSTCCPAPLGRYPADSSSNTRPMSGCLHLGVRQSERQYGCYPPSCPDASGFDAFGRVRLRKLMKKRPFPARVASLSIFVALR